MSDDNSNWVDPDAVRPGDAKSDEKTPGEKLDEELDALDPEIRAKAEQFSEAARKIATETGYAFAGFAGLVGEKAKQFYEEQRKQYAETHPEAEKDPGAKEFLQQLADKLNGFVDELTRGYKDLADRGRENFGHADTGPSTTGAGTGTGTGTGTGSGTGTGTEGPSPEDLPSAVVTDADLYEEPVVEPEPPIVPDPEARDDL